MLERRRSTAVSCIHEFAEKAIESVVRLLRSMQILAPEAVSWSQGLIKESLKQMVCGITEPDGDSRGRDAASARILKEVAGQAAIGATLDLDVAFAPLKWGIRQDGANSNNPPSSSYPFSSTICFHSAALAKAASGAGVDTGHNSKSCRCGGDGHATRGRRGIGFAGPDCRPPNGVRLVAHYCTPPITGMSASDSDADGIPIASPPSPPSSAGRRCQTLSLFEQSRVVCRWYRQASQSNHAALQVTLQPHRLCPVCRTPARLLPDSSANSIVEYYRCDDCGRIWSHRKDNPESPQSRSLSNGNRVLRLRP